MSEPQVNFLQLTLETVSEFFYVAVIKIVTSSMKKWTDITTMKTIKIYIEEKLLEIKLEDLLKLHLPSGI